MNEYKQKLWAGRFEQPTAAAVEEFSASVHFDKRLYEQDIAGSMAHARMLNRIGILSNSELSSIIEGLQEIQNEIEADAFEWSVELEDVHMNIEQRLTEKIGNAGKKLHTGRSRNDQVATDLRLYVRAAVDAIVQELTDFQLAILEKAADEAETIMPGYTHLQIAQPITFGHHLMAWFEMLHRDHQRFLDARKRINQSPLGAAALAGTGFPIDRAMSAQELGFDGVCRNSLDAVSDRDFAIETAAHAALTMVHLSRFGEEIVLWACEAYRFIRISDRFTTGSSIMPQKKNPDIAELVRGKSARAIGSLQALLVLMKAQPLAYNRDNQEDKESLFDSLDTTLTCIRMMHEMLLNIEPCRPRMRQAASDGFSTATDLADYLVSKGVPFREAHHAIGQIVRHCLNQSSNLESLSLADLQSFHPSFDAGALNCLLPETSVAARNHIGGTAPEQVKTAVQEGRRRLSEMI